jgi:uncharacterized membrane protein (DUF373 family)
MYARWQSQFNHWKELMKRILIVHKLELLQDFIVLSLSIILFCAMLLELGDMLFALIETHNTQGITSDTLLVLILVELFRLLVIYLQERQISVGVAVEVAMVSVLREVIVRGLLEIPGNTILAACLFLLVLGFLLRISPWISVKSENASTKDHFNAVENLK